MEPNTLRKQWVQGQMVRVDDLGGVAFTGEANAHTFLISGIDQDGSEVPISGTITGKVLNAAHTQVPLSGSVSDGVASITMSQDCYAVPGRFVLSVFATTGDATACIYCGVGTINNTGSGAVVYPTTGLPDLVQLVAQVQEVIGSIPPDYSSLVSRVDDLKSAISAEEYDSSTVYYMDDYVWHNNKLYRANGNNGVAEAWNAGHWNQVSSMIEVKRALMQMCATYDSTKAYAVGDYCRYLGTIRRCKIAIAAGGEAWTSGHWVTVSLDAMNEMRSVANSLLGEIANLQSQIDLINTPVLAPQVVCMKSWDVKTERFEHVTYSEKLFSGETLIAQTALLIEKDYNIKFHNNPYSVHFKTKTTTTSTEIRITVTGFTLLGTQEFEMPMYISNATNITDISFRVGGGIGFTKSNDVTPVTGWNKFRFFSEGAGNWDESNEGTVLRIIVTHSSGTDTDLYIGSIMQIKPDKGSLIIIDDGPYYSFYANAYPTLKQLGVPVCWAIDPTMLDAAGADPRKLINETELETLATDGISEFSFHSYDGTVMQDATAEEALYDTLNCIRYLKKKGIQPNKVWRAAWLNNACANPQIANLELDASASYTGASGIAVYPFRDRYNIPRYGLGGRTDEEIDAIFEKLRKEHCIQMIYLHGVSTADRDTDPTKWAHFVTKLQAALTAGYLMPTTYNRLISYFKPKT